MRLVTTIFLSFCLLGVVHSQNNFNEQSKKLGEQLVKENLFSEDTSFVVTSSHTSSTTGIIHVYFSQVINGLIVAGTESSLHVNRTGDVVAKNSSFIQTAANFSSESNQASISALDGIRTALTSLGYSGLGTFVSLQKDKKMPQKRVLVDPDATFEDIPAQLQFLRDRTGELLLTWQYLIQDKETGDGWTVALDARTGAVVQTLDWTQECTLEYNLVEIATAAPEPKPKTSEVIAAPLNCSNCYEVFPMPSEGPYDGAREIVEAPANLIASPEGWHGDFTDQGPGDFTTIGNNCWAFDANDNYGYLPDGGAGLDFTGYPWSPDYTNMNQYEDASITNLFYWVNVAHDVSFQYGFDEASGNLQNTNYTGYGLEEDAIRAKAQTSPDNCNASFGLGPDGFKATMSMNICDDRDGNYDSTVILHEFGHAIYGRLTGGANSTYCVYNEERTTEGVADWYAIMLTMKSSDTEEQERHIARYFFDRGADGEGIRRYPYSTDMSKNPHTYDDIKGASVPHGVGAVWGNVLWEITWTLVNKHGFNPDVYAFTGDYEQDAGNIQALAIVTEALKLQPCTPGFVTARDAIFAADRALYNGQNTCQLWKAFAKRGLGVNAQQGSADEIFDNTQSFELPPEHAVFNQVLSYCFDDSIYPSVGGALPYGGIYSGPGVTDNGDGATFTLDITAAGIGIHTITYEVFDGECSVASTDTTEVEIILDEEAPMLYCVEDLVELIPTDTTFTIYDYTTSTILFENCDIAPIFTQDPAPGTEVPIGDYPITIRAQDRSGNVGSCTFLLSVRKLVTFESAQELFLELFPNPSSGSLILSNAKLLKLSEISFYDMNGRFLKKVPLIPEAESTILSVDEFAPGMYFAFVKTDSETIVKRFIRE